MGWRDVIDKVKGAAPIAANTPEASKGAIDHKVLLSTSIRGFTVLDLAYPNHLHLDHEPVTNYDLALRLSHDMDLVWFANDAELKHFRSTGPVQGNAANEDAFGFDFGPLDQTTSEFAHHYTVIVRETAGGGFMLLLEDSALGYADQIRELFKAIIEDPERENPDLSDDDEGTAAP